MPKRKLGKTGAEVSVLCLGGMFDTIIIGGGIAGITAAIEASEAGCEVVLVEKKPYLGGRVAQMFQYFPKLCPPTCGLEINFHYGQAGLHNVRAESFFAGRHPRADIRASRDQSIHIHLAAMHGSVPHTQILQEIIDQAAKAFRREKNRR